MESKPGVRQFIEFQRERVRIHEKGESLAGGLVDPDGFHLNVMGVEVSDRPLDIRHFEGEVSQTLGLWITEAAWSVRKREQLDLGAIRESQVEFPRIPLSPVTFRNQSQSECLCIEALGSGVIRSNDGGVMEASNHWAGGSSSGVSQDQARLAGHFT